MVAVVKRFMVLSCGEQEVILAIHQRMDRTLGSLQKFLDHDPVARVTEQPLFHDPMDGLFRLSCVVGDNYPFA